MNILNSAYFLYLIYSPEYNRRGLVSVEQAFAVMIRRSDLWQQLLTILRKGFFMNMYVGNLTFSVNEDDLKAVFSEFGEIESIKIIKDKFSGQSKGFGFVEMPSNSEADKAIKALNGSPMKGQAMKVNQANPKGNRASARKSRR